MGNENTDYKKRYSGRLESLNAYKTEFALKRGVSPGMRYLRCRAWLNKMWKLLEGQIDVICYEQAHS